MKRFLLSFILLATFFAIEANAQLITSSQIVIKKEKKVREKKILSPVKKGFQNSVSAGFLYGIDAESCIISVDYIGGYRFNNTLLVGAGIGAHFNVEGYYYPIGWNEYFDINDELNNGRYLHTPTVSIPIYAHIRAYLTKTRCQPFFALSVGGRFSKSQEQEIEIYDQGYTYKYQKYNTCGFLIEPMFGADFRLNDDCSLNLQAGVNLQGWPYFEQISAKQATTKSKLAYGISIKIGCTF